MADIIDVARIDKLLARPSSDSQIAEILAKSRQLKRLTMDEVAVLLKVNNPEQLQEIFSTAKQVKDDIYGHRLVIFAPLYISNLCQNDCAYCAFRASNHSVSRRALSQEEIAQETLVLLKSGQKRVLLVSGETRLPDGLDYIMRSIDTIYSVRDGKNNIRRLNLNIAPVGLAEFKTLKTANIGTYQLFQETYHLPTYKKLHTSGPKADYQYRLETVDRAFAGGIDDVGIGVLFGLYDYKFEVLALLAHIEHLEATYGLGPHTISVPRLEPASGAPLASQPPYPVDDISFNKIVAILRLAVPYTGLILSTRESAESRRIAFDLGISQISAGSKTNPGGYSNQQSLEQFSLGDHRTLDEVIYDVCANGYIPSFCTGCYRLGRTGLDFMEYAKPGAIKLKCAPNALVTLQEYLSDYASNKTKAIGEQVIARELAELPALGREKAMKMLAQVNAGERDLFM